MTPARSGGHEILLAEDVWGEPFESLARSHAVARRPDAWADEAELRRLVGNACALVVRNRTQVTARLLDAGPHLQVVARAGVGLDNIDVAAADERGVVVVAPLGANATSVAEHTLALALALVRELFAHDGAVRSGEWVRRPGRELAGRTWGLLGAGATGRAVSRLARGFGMTVRGYDPFLGDEVARQAGVELTDMDAVLESADVLSIHLPATPQTRNLLGPREFALVRPGCLLISVGRGEVVDEQALADALRRGQVGGAGLDVRAQEPPQPGPLDTAPKVIFTPHVAGITVESQSRIGEIIATNIAAVLDGGEASHAVGAYRRPADVAAST